jgi:predicted dehydrogenase
MLTVLRSIHIGVANRGVWPLALCTPQRGFRPVALVDVSPQALQEARAKVGLPESACFTDAQQALEQVQADCVIICAPTRFHLPLTKLALSKRLPVLVEKGMAPDFASALEFVRAVEQAAVPVCIAQNYRYGPMERTILSCISDPSHPAHTGFVYCMDYVQHRVRPEPRTLTYPFASVWDMSCHHFDNLLAWFGPAEWMQATSLAAPWSAYPHDNNTSAIIRMANGTTVNYCHTHDASRGQLVISLHGQRGALWLNDAGDIYFSQRPTEQFGTRPAQIVPRVEAPGQAGVLADFHRYITQGVEPGISARNNLQVMAMCEMMVRAITTGRRIYRHEVEQQGESST